MEGATTTMTEAITSALAQITDLTSSALSVITDNPVLMVFFCGGLIGVGFSVIRRAKAAARG